MHRATHPVAWIDVVSENEATGLLKDLYDKARTPHGTVDNVMKVHSLRPHTMQGHIALYKSVLHHDDNTLPTWLMEVVASYTSVLNKCEYSLAHHFSNARKLLADDSRADDIYDALRADIPESVFSGKELAMLRYTKKLTCAVGKMQFGNIEELRDAGCDDGEILELNQVIAYFNYSNRLLNGLGVTTEGDSIGYYS
jgi:uncharacterized peroxidase-related enzyme